MLTPPLPYINKVWKLLPLIPASVFNQQQDNEIEL